MVLQLFYGIECKICKKFVNKKNFLVLGYILIAWLEKQNVVTVLAVKKKLFGTILNPVAVGKGGNVGIVEKRLRT